jgi:hypothetical protein
MHVRLTRRPKKKPNVRRKRSKCMIPSAFLFLCLFLARLLVQSIGEKEDKTCKVVPPRKPPTEP